MSLFPAYAPEGGSTGENQVSENVINLTEELRREDELLAAPEPIEIDDSSKDSQEKHKKKRKHSKKHKDKDKKKKIDKNDPASKLRLGDDFYLDANSNYGYLKVTTLYNPARPQYISLKSLIGRNLYIRMKKQKKPKRYYNAKFTQQQTEKVVDTNSPKKRKKKSTEDYIDITDSGKQWTDEGVDKKILDKTAHFNKSLDSNPYNIDMWLEYVKFQDEIMQLDIASKRIASVATARSMCYSKQISILDTALKHNFNSQKLLSKKIKLSEQSMSNEQYLSMLKKLITTAEIQNTLLNRAWFWYLDGVQYSMAICSVPTVKDMYAGAIKALSKALKQDYQKTHIDILYRLGLYLRQAGLWEQLWTLLKLNIEVNLLISKEEKTLDLENLIPKVDEDVLLGEEIKIISSGLPMHEVWSRIELIRSKVHWLPTTSETEDPQRIVFSSDFADFIKPVVNKSDLFALTIKMLRLLKIPLLPITHQMIINDLLDWEYDGTESFLCYVYEEINTYKSIDTTKLKFAKKVLDNFSEEPNYFTDTDFFKFTKHFMIQCSKWFEDDEKTAIITWYIRWVRSVLAIYNCDSEEAQSKNSMVIGAKKLIKDLLRLHRDNVFIYKEYSLLEAQISSPQQGLTIMETCLKSLPSNRNVARIHLCRSYVEMCLRDDLKNDGTVNVNKNILAALALNQSISTDPRNKHDISITEDVLNEFTDYTDKLIISATNFDRDVTLVEHLIPDITLDWICCQGWYLYLTQNSEGLQRFYKKICIATTIDKLELDSFSSKRLIKLREGFMQWYISLLTLDMFTVEENFRDEQNLLQDVLHEFPLNTAIIWQCINGLKNSLSGRLRLNKLIDDEYETSQHLAMGLIFLNFINLYKKYDPIYKDSWTEGHNNRMLKILQMLTAHPVLKKCILIWRMAIEYTACHTEQPIEIPKKYLYQALDECPWSKAIYFSGCVRVPSEFSALIDIMLEKQIRLHAMPEELQSL